MLYLSECLSHTHTHTHSLTLLSTGTPMLCLSHSHTYTLSYPQVHPCCICLSVLSLCHTHTHTQCFTHILRISRPFFKSQSTPPQALPLPEMTTETAAEIGRKRLVDSSELKKKYIHIYKKHSAPPPRTGPGSSFLQGQGRGTRTLPAFSKAAPFSPSGSMWGSRWQARLGRPP